MYFNATISMNGLTKAQLVIAREQVVIKTSKPCSNND